MRELKYYKLSGKIDLLKYTFYFILAIVVSYLIGLLYLKSDEIVHYLIFEKILKTNIQFESFSDKLGFIFAKLMSHSGKAGLIVLVLILILPLLIILLLFVPFTITIFSLVGVTHYLRKEGKSRNRLVDSIIFIILFFISFIVSNKYKIDSITNYFELAVFLIFGYTFSQSSTNYFCEKCTKNYKETKFYSVSELNADDYLEDVIKKGIDIENRYEEKEILEKEDIEKLYYVELNKCDTCNSQIVKIESKIFDVNSDGKKKIKEGKKITEDLLIN